MTVNKELLVKTLETIKQHPEHWNQRNWHCGTTHCFAGFCELIVKKLSPNVDLFRDVLPQNIVSHDFWRHTRNFAKDNLGISEEDANKLFSPHNSLEDLERLVNHLCVHGNLDNVFSVSWMT